MHGDFVLLDAVTPCYLNANAVRNVCNAVLAMTLRELLALIRPKLNPSGLALSGPDGIITGSDFVREAVIHTLENAVGNPLRRSWLSYASVESMAQ
jgi:hypothetical protein